MRRIGLPALLLIVMAVYLPTLSFPLVYEDKRDSTAIVTSEGGLAELWSEMAAKPSRSLTTASFWLTRQVSLQPWAFHAGNVLLHVVNTWLFYGLAYSVLPWRAALLAAAIFGLHPLQVEAVAYVSSRSELLAGLGVLLALRAATAGRVAWAVGGCLVAFLAKEAAAVAWGLVPLWAWWTRAPKFPFLGWAVVSVMLLPAGVIYATQFEQLQVDLQTIVQTLRGTVGLVSLFWLPVGQTIDPDWSQWFLFHAALIVLVVGWIEGFGSPLGVKWLRRAVVFTLVTFSPRFLIPTYEGLHEHHFYVPSLAWALCAAGAWTFPAHERI